MILKGKKKKCVGERKRDYCIGIIRVRVELNHTPVQTGRVPILFSGISHDGGGDDGDELYDMYRKRNLPPSVDLGLCCAMLCVREKNTHTHTVKRYYMTSLKQKG